MLYLVSGTMHSRDLLSRPHEEFIEVVKGKVAPSLKLIEQFQKEGMLLAGGIPAGSQDLVFILNLPVGETHFAVRRLLLQLPIFPFYQWQVKPLETFEEWSSLVG